MNIRELCIYIKNYMFGAQYFKVLPFLIISMCMYCILLVLHHHGYVKQKDRAWKMIGIILLLSFEMSVIVVTTLIREPVLERIEWELIPFTSYIKAVSEKSMGTTAQIIMNIFMYIPLGFSLPSCFKLFEKSRYVILVAIFFSGSVEVLQGLARLGLFETDDVINNVFGVIIGLGIYIAAKKVIEHEEETD